MFGRTVAFGAGISVGMAGGWYVKRQVRRQMERVAPDQLVDEVGVRIRRAGGELRAAVSEGREVMRRYASEAQAELEVQRRRGSLRAVS